MDLILRNVEVEGRSGLDVLIEDGRIAAVGERLPRAPDEVDGRGGALIPGLWDHHIHILALAAREASLDLFAARDPDDLARRIAEAAAAGALAPRRRLARGADGRAGSRGAGSAGADHPCGCSTRPGRCGC